MQGFGRRPLCERWLANRRDCPRLTGSRHAKFAGRPRLWGVLLLCVIALLWEEQTMTIATNSSTARRSLLHHVPELALALAGTAVVLLALGVVAFPFLVADLDAVGGVFRSCRRDRLGNSTCHWALAARSAGHRARRRGAYRGCPDCLRALALRPDPSDGATNPRHHHRSGQSASLCRGCPAAARRRHQFGCL